jgi:hypothetical protein
MDYLIVGDVQGCHAELLDLLDAARFDPAREQLVFVGDLVNRGPSSPAVLEVAVRHGALAVLGNHEEALCTGERSLTLDRVRAQLGADLARWEKWIRALPLFLALDGCIVVHAGIAPGRRPEQCSREELLNLRQVDGRPWFESWRGPETVVFGHWAQRGLVDTPLAKGLDTGCVYGRRLTALRWPRCELISVPARRVWYDPITKKPNW